MTRRTLFGWLAGLVAGLGGAKVAASPEPTPRLIPCNACGKPTEFAYPKGMFVAAYCGGCHDVHRASRRCDFCGRWCRPGEWKEAPGPLRPVASCKDTERCLGAVW